MNLSFRARVVAGEDGRPERRLYCSDHAGVLGGGFEPRQGNGNLDPSGQGAMGSPTDDARSFNVVNDSPQKNIVVD